MWITILESCIRTAACLVSEPRRVWFRDYCMLTFTVASIPFAYVRLIRRRTALRACRAAAPWLRPLQLLLPDCIDPLRDCCSPFASAARRLRPLRLLFPEFNSSRIACASAAAPRLRPLVASPALEDSSPCPMFSNVLRGVRGSEVRRSRVTTSLVPPPHWNIPFPSHTHVII